MGCTAPLGKSRKGAFGTIFSKEAGGKEGLVADPQEVSRGMHLLDEEREESWGQALGIQTNKEISRNEQESFEKGLTAAKCGSIIPANWMFPVGFLYL